MRLSHHAEQHQSRHARDEKGYRRASRQPREPHQEGGQRSGVDDGTEPVEAAGALPPLGPAQEEEVEQQVDDAVRGPEGEDRAPTEVEGQDPAHHRSHDLAHVDGGDQHAHGSSALAGGVGQRHHGHRTGEHHRGTYALRHAQDDQGSIGGNESQSQRAQDEEHQPQEIQQPAAVQVGDLAQGHQEHRRREHVRQRDPAQGHGSQVEFGLDGGEGDIDGRGHERAHPHGHAVDHEDVGSVHGTD